MNSIQILLDGVIDYAGLFPPSTLDIQTIVNNYASYLKGDKAQMLGRLVVPVSRLRDFEDAAAALLPRGNPVYPWKLSVIGSGDIIADLEELVDFNVFHARDENVGAVVIDTIELKAESVEDVYRAMYLIPRSLIAYFEIPIEKDPTTILEAIMASKARAKVRTGGITKQAFPSAQNLAQFICRCADQRVQFKATAGLHHPMRGTYKLTYAPDSESSMMYGFLNILLATAFARFDFSEEETGEILNEKDPAAFIFDEEGVQWRRHRLTLHQLGLARKQIVMAVGVCSFEEPMNDLLVMKLI